MRHHTIISGTGRAGTTLLVRVLTRAGLDTGFTPETFPIDPVSAGGLELDIREPGCPTIVKSPWIASYIGEVLADPTIAIDHAIICMRDLYSAAESRRRVQRVAGDAREAWSGLFMTRRAKDQERVLAELFHQLIFHLTAHNVPLTFLHFPRFARDAEYLADTLRPVFPSLSRTALTAALRAEVSPELIHTFPAPAG